MKLRYRVHISNWECVVVRLGLSLSFLLTLIHFVQRQHHIPSILRLLVYTQNIVIRIKQLFPNRYKWRRILITMDMESLQRYHDYTHAHLLNASNHIHIAFNSTACGVKIEIPMSVLLYYFGKMKCKLVGKQKNFQIQ